ncbi:PDR/VanB family oxidoreductase [Gordonia westfalica]|uniref:Ferredoxin-NADP reductase n=1 Tax=Gordonia westfalica TaxID=158898 RepID=A0A1H2L276_9ACTN|nr:Ferredoxin-NADP reductase [Gordonia westfalica]
MSLSSEPLSSDDVAQSSPAIAQPVRVRVTARRPVADRVDEFVLSSASGEPLPAWSAGSHVDLVAPSGVVRQYSLCPAGAGSYRVVVERRADGRGGSMSVHDDLAVADEAWISVPRNHFALTRALGYVFVAGGIGITPILALIDEARAAGRPWRLLYIGRSRAEMAYADELAAAHPDHVTVHESRVSGRLNLGEALAGLPRGTAVYACGPATMLDAVADACAPQPAVDSFTERFTAAIADRVPSEEFELSLAMSGVTLTVPEDRTILEALDGAGVVAPSSCREGMCGTCETGVVSGEVDHRDAVLSPEERSENESMMICVSRCTSGRLVLEL